MDAVVEMRSDAKSIGNETEKVKEKGKGKQSTLDNFVGIAEKENQTVQFQENDAEIEEESTCTHQIDTEAAKTWIYPGSNNSLVEGFLIFIYFFNFILFWVCLVQWRRLKGRVKGRF
jgi:hypothetical protein